MNTSHTYSLLKKLNKGEAPIILHEETLGFYQYQWADGSVVRLSEDLVARIDDGHVDNPEAWLKEVQAHQANYGMFDPLPSFNSPRDTVKEGFGGTKPAISDTLKEGFGGTKPSPAIVEGFGGTKPAHVTPDAPITPEIPVSPSPVEDEAPEAPEHATKGRKGKINGPVADL